MSDRLADSNWVLPAVNAVPVEVERLIDATRRYLKTGSLTAEMDMHDALKAVERLAESNWCYRP